MAYTILLKRKINDSMATDAPNPCDKRIFRDVHSFQRYQDLRERKYVGRNFHVLRPTDNPEVFDTIFPFAKCWSFEELLNLSKPGYTTLTYLFYANLIKTNDPLTLSTWLLGKEVTISLYTLRDWFNLEFGPEFRKPVISLMDDEIEDAHTHLFGKNRKPKITNLHPSSRLVFYLINNILLPSPILKNYYSVEDSFLLKTLWYMSGKIDPAFLILTHMANTENLSYLPYGNLIAYICEKEGILIPDTIKEHGEVPNIDLFKPSLYPSYNLHLDLHGVYSPKAMDSMIVFPRENESHLPSHMRYKTVVDELQRINNTLLDIKQNQEYLSTRINGVDLTVDATHDTLTTFVGEVRAFMEMQREPLQDNESVHSSSPEWADHHSSS